MTIAAPHPRTVRLAVTLLAVVVAGLLGGWTTLRDPPMHAGQGGSSPEHTMADGTVMSGASMTHAPSPAAKMICADETRKNVATMLGTSGRIPTTDSFLAQRYTCTYRLPQGPLVLSVDDVHGMAAAERALALQRARLGATTPIAGLASLGLPGYESGAGAVVFRKDDKVLVIDARGLPPAVGSSHLTRADLAYQIATDVLACWSGN